MGAAAMMNPMMVQAMAAQMAQMGLPPMSMNQIQNLLLQQMMSQKMPSQAGMFMSDFKVRVCLQRRCGQVIRYSGGTP